MFTIAAFFATGGFVYSLIGRRDMLFVLLQAVMLVLFVPIGWLCSNIGPHSLRGLVVAGVFLTALLIPRFIIRKDPVELVKKAKDDVVGTVEAVEKGDLAEGIMVPGGKKQHPKMQTTDKPTQTDRPTIWLGIIDCSWIFMMSGSLAFGVFAIGTEPFTCLKPPENMPVVYYENSLQVTQFLLDQTLNAFFILGGILGVSMSILWAGELWTKRGSSERAKYRAVTLASIQMVIGFIVCGLAAMVWVGVPLYHRMSVLLNCLK